MRSSSSSLVCSENRAEESTTCGTFERVWCMIAGSSISSSSREDSSSFFMRMSWQEGQKGTAARPDEEGRTATAKYAIMAGEYAKRKSNRRERTEREVKSWLIRVRTQEREK